MLPAVRRAGCALISMLVVIAVAAPATMAAPEGKAVAVSSLANGAKRIKYKIGPFNVVPGQNEIGYEVIREKPQVDGYFTRIRPDLTYLDGRVPGVDVIHLHHGVWVNTSRRAHTSSLARGALLRRRRGEDDPAAAEGLRLSDQGVGLPAPQPHDPQPDAGADAGVHGLRGRLRAEGLARRPRDAPVRPIWMDVQNGSLYPVFNVEKGSGENGRYTYPDDARNPYGGGPRKNEWVVDRPGVLVATAGHLHPGGLHTDLYVRRRGAKIRPSRRADAPRGRGNTAHLFRSVAKYYEPAGAVSWDVAMTGTRPDWRVKLRRGDVLSTSATYDTKRGAWWESMGIMVAYMADGGPGRDPFKKRVNYRGSVTHGHLPENDNHGGRPTGLPDPRQLPDGAEQSGQRRHRRLQVPVRRPEPARPGRPPAGDPPRARRSTSATRSTTRRRSTTRSPRARRPATARPGIAYPIADGDVQFESNTLGSAVPPATGALEWKTPDNLEPGTYTYFCRIHPFMRGAFRVKQ